jgi:hypothetical protein
MPACFGIFMESSNPARPSSAHAAAFAKICDQFIAVLRPSSPAIRHVGTDRLVFHLSPEIEAVKIPDTAMPRESHRRSGPGLSRVCLCVRTLDVIVTVVGAKRLRERLSARVSPLSELSPVLNRGTFYQLIIYCGLNEREIFAFFCAMPCGGHVSSSCGEPRRIRTS